MRWQAQRTVAARKAERRQAGPHPGRAARGRAGADSREGLRADDARGSGEARRHDDRRDLRQLQESPRAVHRARADVLGADSSRKSNRARRSPTRCARSPPPRSPPSTNGRPVAVGRLTGLAYTLKNPDLRAQVHEITKNSYEIGADWLRTFDASELPMPPEHLVRVIHALIEGLVMQRILTPELCSRRGVLRGVRRAGDEEMKWRCVGRSRCFRTTRFSTNAVASPAGDPSRLSPIWARTYRESPSCMRRRPWPRLPHSTVRQHRCWSSLRSHSPSSDGPRDRIGTPQLLPPCAKYHPSFRRSMLKPTAYGPVPTGETIACAIGRDRTCEPPRRAFCTSIANFARSVGVVHKPAGACSGYTCHFVSIGCPRPLCARAALESRPGGNGCSNVLAVIPIGSSTSSRMISSKGPAERVGQQQLHDHGAATGVFERGERRALPEHTPDVGRLFAVQNLHQRWPLGRRSVARKAEAIAGTRTCGSRAPAVSRDRSRVNSFSGTFHDFR